jgi:hypothetical protein
MVLENGDQFMFQSNAGSQRRTFHLIIAFSGEGGHVMITLVSLLLLIDRIYTRQMCNIVSGTEITGGIKNQF